MKGKVDFAVFNAEDLIAATNLYAPLLITNELQFNDCKYYSQIKHRQMELRVQFFIYSDNNQYEMVVVVNNESGIKSKHDLIEKKFCHPGYDSEADSNRIISNVSILYHVKLSM